MSDGDFGNYLATVTERDIDLLLMEEFHVSDPFVAWFCAQCGLTSVVSDGAWHSVSETDGETDLLLRVISGNRRVGVMIENKINAPEQDKQAERYHLRGIRSQEAGKVDEYITVMCAPERYLDSIPSDSLYQHRVSYEAIAHWFGGFEDRRSTWRRRIMQEAVAQGRRGYTMLVSQINTQFHRDYWQNLQREHPRLQMRRPTNKGGKSTWIIMKGLDFPRGVQLHHKLDQAVVELGFERRRIEEILEVQSEWPEDIIPIQKNGTAALMIRVPRVDMKASIASQVDAIGAALDAAYRLLPYASLFTSKS